MKWRTIQPKISLKIFLSLKLTLYLAVVCIASNSSTWANQCPRYWPGLKEVEKQSLHGFHVWDHILFCLQDNYQVINWLWKEGIPRHPCLQGLCSSLCINSANTCMFAESVSDNLENQMTVSGGKPPAQDLLQSRCSIKYLWSSASCSIRLDDASLWEEPGHVCGWLILCF